MVNFVEAFISHDKHTLHLRREWTSSEDLHMRVPVGNSILIGLDLSMTVLVDVTERRKKIITCTQTK
jgi:hypothetical protein